MVEFILSETQNVGKTPLIHIDEKIAYTYQNEVYKVHIFLLLIPNTLVSFFFPIASETACALMVVSPSSTPKFRPFLIRDLACLSSNF